jgi:transcriptional regulator with XRE-family HTH domain
MLFYDGTGNRSIGKAMLEDQRTSQSAVLREILTNLRTTAQLTQAQLSSKLSRPQSYVSKYESGERKLTFIEVREIAICTGSTLLEIVDAFEEELTVTES